jgi:hypothetical protein
MQKSFIAKREVTAYIGKDGKLTSMKGAQRLVDLDFEQTEVEDHSVFIAQHAMAICCRECICE